MENNLKIGIVNQLNAGTQILMEGDKVTIICLVVKGRVLIKSKGIQITVGSGSFLGICDLFIGTYQASYYAMDGVTLYAFSVGSEEGLEHFLSGNRDYPGFVVGFLSKYIEQIYKIYSNLLVAAKRLHTFSNTMYEKYKTLGKDSGFATKVMPDLENLENFNYQTRIQLECITYYQACNKIASDVQKAYYGIDKNVYMYHIREQINLVTQMIWEANELSDCISKLFNCLVSDEKSSLFYGIADLAVDINSMGSKNNDIMTMVDTTVDMINETERLLIEKAGLTITVNRDRMEKTYYQLISGKPNAKEKQELALDESLNIETLREIWQDSLERILAYSEVSDDIKQSFKAALGGYRSLNDKLSTEDKARTIRKQLSKYYYQIYKAVFKKFVKEKNQEIIFTWFLDYGFMDHTLLTEEQLLTIYQNQNEVENEGPCNVFTMSEWLTEIYEGRKEPSKSEFDLDYSSYLREQRKANAITDAQMKEYEEDQNRKLEYEIANMFIYNNRIVSGQASVFIPILHEDNFPINFEKALQNARKINSVVNRLLSIDYSIFYRETVYSNEKKRITREFIQKEVFPDIILLPNNGTNGSMWQDISDKVRTSSGRFLLPIFVENAIDDIMIQLFARFRWELCRTIQGATWNNMKYPSMTAEYSDYIQFYRKNRALTEDKKEKLKLQMQRARGSSRETFVIDYAAWVRFESQGSIRLNKVVRELLATYCPFAKSLRDKIITQPLFSEAMEKSERDRRKKLKEYELKLKMYEKENIEIPPEVEKTVEFYRDM